MKNFRNVSKRVKSLAMVGVALFSVIPTACSFTPSEETRKVDPNKTQFYIANYNGGYGHEWVDIASKKFEEKYANVSFEADKTGVQIWVTNKKDEYDNYQLFSTISSLPESLFITQPPRDEIIDGKLILSLEDIADASLEEFGETGTIRDKLSDYYKEAHQGETVYYLPYSEAYFGNFVYDIDLFEEKKFFMKDGGGWTGADNKSAGLDGIKGTLDDGLPTTDVEFFNLLDRIYSRGVIPMTFAGQYLAYANAWGSNIFLNYDDGVGMKAYNTCSGEYTFDGDTEPTVFNGYNFYDVARFPGRLPAVEVSYKVVKNVNYYSGNAFKTTQSHIEAQDEFITSVMADQRIAMLIEGSWWENEASDTFARMAKNDSEYAHENRHFGIMPCFKPTGSTATKTSFLTEEGAMFINANTKNVALAKKILTYFCTNEVREIFTACTGCPSPYKYEISGETYDSLTGFGKNLWDIHQNKNNSYNFVLEYNRLSPSWQEYTGVHYPQIFSTNACDGTKDIISACPFSFFKFDTDGVTPQKYFDGMYDVSIRLYDAFFADSHGRRG